MKPARLARKSGEKQFVVDINFVLCYLVKSVVSRFPRATENGWERELEMYYSAIGILAVFVLFIENMDVLLNIKGAFNKPSWRVYRRLLCAVFLYYVTDILWGWLEYRKLSSLLFADTTFYFIVMAMGVMFLTQYVVTYLNDKTGFGRFLIVVGVLFPLTVTALAIINMFRPVLFVVDDGCVYRALPVRYALLGIQILLLVVMSVYALSFILRKGVAPENRKRYRTLAWFSLIMAAFLSAQLWFPNYPLYAVAYMMGTCLIRAVVVGDEKEEYRQDLMETRKNAELKKKISTMFDNMAQALAHNMSTSRYGGVVVACGVARYRNDPNVAQVFRRADKNMYEDKAALKAYLSSKPSPSENDSI